MPDVKETVEDENKIGTVIADDIHFKGHLKFKNSLKIKGKFEGKIETDNHLIIGREAVVSADVQADVVSISGNFSGKIKTGQRIDLYKKSRTSGDLLTPELNIEGGSLFNGTCIMEEKK